MNELSPELEFVSDSRNTCDDPVHIIQLDKLYPFHEHPFKVIEDESFEVLVQSIRQQGIITPSLARPKAGEHYELISGHRRMAACRKLGLDSMPVILREMDDSEAVIAMVDSNLQREHILPSEKAFAYKMKRDALGHQGRASPQIGEKLLTAQMVGAASGDSKNQVLRYIRLTYLIPDLLSMVDAKRIAFNPAVEISFLKSDEQYILLDAIQQYACTPSHAQSIQLKKLSCDNLLTADQIRRILSEPKPNQRPKISLVREDLNKYFSGQCTDEQIKQDILEGLELLQQKRFREIQNS